MKTKLIASLMATAFLSMIAGAVFAQAAPTPAQKAAADKAAADAAAKAKNASGYQTSKKYWN